MATIYDRLGFSFDTTKFGGDDVLDPGVINLLNMTPSTLSAWQTNDLGNNTVSGYYKNPHTTNINSITNTLNSMIAAANTTTYNFGSNSFLANNLVNMIVYTKSSLVEFTNHVNNISGVTKSPDASVYPDLNSALAIGRQMLTLTNKTDGIQNNTPVLGSFTSLYIGSDLDAYKASLTLNYSTLSGGISGNTNTTSSASLNSIITNLENMTSFINNRTYGDINFYKNAYAILNDYQTVAQFSNMGATQTSLISIIGTDKLKANLGM